MKRIVPLLLLCFSCFGQSFTFNDLAFLSQCASDPCTLAISSRIDDYQDRVNAINGGGSFTTDAATTNLFYNLCHYGLWDRIDALYLFETLTVEGDKINAAKSTNNISSWNDILSQITYHTVNGLNGRGGIGTINWEEGNLTNIVVGAWINDYIPKNFTYDGDFMTPLSGDTTISILADGAVDADGTSYTNHLYGASGAGGMGGDWLRITHAVTNYSNTFIGYARWNHTNEMTATATYKLDPNYPHAILTATGFEATNLYTKSFTNVYIPSGQGYQIQTQFGSYGNYPDTKVRMVFIAHDMGTNDLGLMQAIISVWADEK